jgi:uncharacterized protein YlxW (UPF0749 family)
MNELKLLYSYEEWKNGTSRNGINSEMKRLSENAANRLMLALKFDKTEEEIAEYERLNQEFEVNEQNRKFTELTHEITDLYNKLKYVHENEDREAKYNEIGRKQCEIEMLKEKEE